MKIRGGGRKKKKIGRNGEEWRNFCSKNLTLNWWKKYYFYERINSRLISIINFINSSTFQKFIAFFINSHSYLELNRWTFETCRRGGRKRKRIGKNFLLRKLNFELMRKLLYRWKYKQAFFNGRTNSTPLSITNFINLYQTLQRVVVSL